MSTHLVGQPLNFTQIEALKCEILLFLRAMPTRAFNSETIRRIVVGNDIGRMVEYAVALTRLEEQGEISLVILGTQMFVKLASNGEKGVMPSDPATRASANGASSKTSGLASGSPYDPRPSIVRKVHEINTDYCIDGCGLIAPDNCPTCDAPVSSVHRYGVDGHHDPLGMCGKCYDEAVMNGGIQ